MNTPFTIGQLVYLTYCNNYMSGEVVTTSAALHTRPTWKVTRIGRKFIHVVHVKSGERLKGSPNKNSDDSLFTVTLKAPKPLSKARVAALDRFNAKYPPMKRRSRAAKISRNEPIEAGGFDRY